MQNKVKLIEVEVFTDLLMNEQTDEFLHQVFQVFALEEYRDVPNDKIVLSFRYQKFRL